LKENPQKILALDVGDKTIGVAVSDGLGITARGLLTVARTGVKKDAGRIMEILRENGCSMVVIGLPLMLDGSDSPQTEKVRDFAAKLENRLRSNAMADVAVKFFDERFSTKIAERAMIEAGMRRDKRKAVIDKMAAVVILQDYLDSTRKT
jgi:putative Holliday junction resolvase